MMRVMLKSKIHRATVTQADLHYVGSIAVDSALMEAADLIEGEQVVFPRVVDHSQQLAESSLLNQIPETVALQRTARLASLDPDDGIAL